MKKHYIAILLAATLGMLFVACTELAVDGPILPQADGGDFVLYVSNQSFALDPVELKVYIDGVLAVNQNFHVKNQHNWVRFQFQLRSGTHRIRAVYTVGETQKEEFFTIEKPLWCVIDFYASKGPGPAAQSFNIMFFNHQVAFA